MKKEYERPLLEAYQRRRDAGSCFNYPSCNPIKFFLWWYKSRKRYKIG